MKGPLLSLIAGNEVNIVKSMMVNQGSTVVQTHSPAFHVQKVIIIVFYCYNDGINSLAAWNPKKGERRCH